MIKIPVSEKQKDDIEKIFWTWISKYHLDGFKKVIVNDDVLKRLIVKDNETLETSLKKYLLNDCNDLARVKAAIDEMRGKGKYLKEGTKQFLKERYKNYRSSQAAKVVNVLGITVCPYCNQNHINIVYKQGKIRYWGDLDHFYDKDDYPEMSICLYNLVPVCKICNQLKSSQKRMIISPYDLEKESNIRFKTEFDDKFDLGYLQGKSQNFNIIIDKENLSWEDKEEIELFDLENRYKQLKQNVQEIIVKSKAYDGIYRKQLQKEFSLNDEELDAYIFGYDEQYLNRVLSKFNMDITNEFRNKETEKML